VPALSLTPSTAKKKKVLKASILISDKFYRLQYKAFPYTVVNPVRK
jgi:hypothetical protein